MEVKRERSVNGGNSKCLEGSAADRKKGTVLTIATQRTRWKGIVVRGKDCFEFVPENGRKKENGEIASNEIP